MDQDNRVLSRKGARELTPHETEHVSGGAHTLTACTFNATSLTHDGDLSEC
jgi:hypothetical protein